MTIVIGLALVVLGLVVGFIVAWAFGAGATLNLFVGLLLVVAGGIVGFVIEWLIRGVSQEPGATATVGAAGWRGGGPGGRCGRARW